MKHKNGGPRKGPRPEPKTRPADERSDIVYGRRPVEELVRKRPDEILEVVIEQAARSWFDSIGSHLSGLRIRQTGADDIEALSGGGNHQGVVAVVKPFRPLPEKELLQKLKRQSDQPSIVVIAEELTDPRNLGSLVRVCDGAGVHAVFITERRSSVINAVVRRASAGATEILPIAAVTNVQRTFEALKDIGYWIVGTDLSDGSSDIYRADLPNRIAVVFGAEGKGLRELTRKRCDFLVHVPMYGALQSLNVSTAAAAVLFELARRHR